MNSNSSNRREILFSVEPFVQPRGRADTRARASTRTRRSESMSPSRSQEERWLSKARGRAGDSQVPDAAPGSVMSSRSVRSADPQESFQYAAGMMPNDARGFTPPNDYDRAPRNSNARYSAQPAESEVRSLTRDPVVPEAPRQRQSLENSRGILQIFRPQPDPFPHPRSRLKPSRNLTPTPIVSPVTKRSVPTTWRAT